ncbi:MAG: hypothetical protein IPH04_02895 [Saprospirales bacterium]|nr:hypothetical protein [Saprospirales bacterium]
MTDLVTVTGGESPSGIKPSMGQTALPLLR